MMNSQNEIRLMRDVNVYVILVSKERNPFLPPFIYVNIY